MPSASQIKRQLRDLAEAHPEEASGQVADHAAELASLVEYLELQVAPLIDAVESRSGPL